MTARVTRDEWIGAARRRLVEAGVGNVKVLSLATELGVARSSFYWFFTNRQALLDELLDIWRSTNTDSTVAPAECPAGSIEASVLAVFEAWLDPTRFDPGLEFAVRSWARRSEPVRRELEKADGTRLAALAGMFARHGFDHASAAVRARVMYFTQLSYYEVAEPEALETRLANAPRYVETFTGRRPTAAEQAAFERAVLAAHRQAVNGD